MTAKPSVGSTGSAKIKKAGHTSSPRDGSNPNMQKRGGGSVRDHGLK